MEVFHDSDQQLLGLLYQDEEMQRMFSVFPEIIFVDATYKLNDRRMPLYILMVEDSLGQSEVVAVCLLNSEEKPVLQQFVKSFKANNPSFTKTKVIMADKDINERDVFTHEIPNATILICQFHVLRTFNREITTEKMGISSAQRHTALELLQQLVYSSSETAYETQMEKIQNTCPRQIYDYLMNNWHHIRSEWVLGLKLCEGSMMNTTNNRLESFNQKLKQVVKLYSSLGVFFDKFLSLIRTLRNERDHRGSVEIQKVSAKSLAHPVNSAESQYDALLTTYAYKYVEDQLKKARRKRETDLTSSNSCISEDGIQLSTESCQCSFRKSMGLPCRHIFFSRIVMDMELYDVSLCDRRWTSQYYEENARLSKPPGNDHTINSVTSITHVEQLSKSVMSANQKYKKAYVLAKKLASVCSEVGMREFEERINKMQELLEAWQNNTDIVINGTSKFILMYFVNGSNYMFIKRVIETNHLVVNER